MAKIRLWRSKEWLKRKYMIEKLNEEQIAEIAGTSQRTINEWLRKFGLKN